MNDIATGPMTRQASTHDFLAGGGEMGALTRAHDWSATPLGPIEAWPQSLRTSVGILLGSRHPMCLGWGPDLIFLYNDSYAPFLGLRHPSSLGAPFAEVWADVWDDVSPLVAQALAGEATWSENLHLLMSRKGYPEDTWWTFSYSPLRDESGDVVGLLNVCNDATGQMLAERRLSTETTRLRESEDRFRNVADHAPVMMWVTDAEARCTYLNRAWYEFTGQTPEQAEGFGWLEATHPDDKAMAEAAFLNANANQLTFRIEYRLRRSDGAYRWAIDAAAPRFGPDGAFLGYVGSVIDIDERREAEDRLRDREERLRTIFDEANDFIFTIGLDQRLTALNPATAAAMGISRDEGIGRSIAEFMSPEDFAKANARLATKLDGGPSTRYEIEVTSAAGERMIWEINSRLNRGPGGAPLGLHVIARDVTDKRRANDALRESEERFRALAEHIPILCWMANADGHIFWYNPRWYAYTGTTPDDQAGWGWQSVHDPAMLPAVTERWTHSIATGEPFEMTFPLKGADGAFRPFLTRVVPLRDDFGSVVRWFGTNTDVTEQRRNEEHLKLLVGELNHRVKNTLAIVQAVARQSLQDVPAEEREGFEGRLQALAAAHNLLTRRIGNRPISATSSAKSRPRATATKAASPSPARRSGSSPRWR